MINNSNNSNSVNSSNNSIGNFLHLVYRTVIRDVFNI